MSCKFAALGDGGLARQHVGEEACRLDVHAPPAVIRHADDREPAAASASLRRALSGRAVTSVLCAGSLR